MDFKERLGKAIDRGTERRDKQQGKTQDQALTEEELKRLHAQYRRDLSEHIEVCVDQIANHRDRRQHAAPLARAEVIRGAGLSVEQDGGRVGIVEHERGMRGASVRKEQARGSACLE